MASSAPPKVYSTINSTINSTMKKEKIMTDLFRTTTTHWEAWAREHGPEAYAALSAEGLFKMAMGPEAERFPRAIAAAADALADISPLLSWHDEQDRLVINRGPLISPGLILNVLAIGDDCEVAAVPPLPAPVHEAFTKKMDLAEVGVTFFRGLFDWFNGEGGDFEDLTTAVLLQHLLSPREGEADVAFWADWAQHSLAFATVALLEDAEKGPFGAFAFPVRARTDPARLPPEAMIFGPRVLLPA